MGVGDVIAWALRILANGGGKRQALLNAIAAATVLYLSKKAQKVSGPAVAAWLYLRHRSNVALVNHCPRVTAATARVSIARG
jgi:hypothetical protein